MKLVQCALALGSFCLQAASQRFANETCDDATCVNGGVCVPFSRLSPEGRTCRIDAVDTSGGSFNKLLSSGVDVSTCANAAAADAACSSIFMHTPGGECRCHVSTNPRGTCDLAPTFDTTVYSAEPTTPYCSCVDATEGYGGPRCDVEKTISFDFVKQLNVLNDVVNSGDLYLRASELAGRQRQVGLFNYISLLSAANLLDRGFDAELTLNIELSQDAGQADWEPVVTEAMVDALKSAGFSVTAGNFQVLEVRGGEEEEEEEEDIVATMGMDTTMIPATTGPATTGPATTGPATTSPTTIALTTTTARPCHCAEVTSAFSSGCDLSCTQLEVVYFVSEVARLVEWELSLIIVASVIVVCLLAIGLSFCKSDASKAASAEVTKPHARNEDPEKGVEMTKTGGF